MINYISVWQSFLCLLELTVMCGQFSQAQHVQQLLEKGEEEGEAHARLMVEKKTLHHFLDSKAMYYKCPF